MSKFIIELTEDEIKRAIRETVEANMPELSQAATGHVTVDIVLDGGAVVARVSGDFDVIPE